MKAVQLTRLPGCKRGERLQKLLYLNPQPDPGGVPLIEMVGPKVVMGNEEGGEVTSMTGVTGVTGTVEEEGTRNE
jgi:hypothetical protein